MLHLMLPKENSSKDMCSTILSYLRLYCTSSIAAPFDLPHPRCASTRIRTYAERERGETHERRRLLPLLNPVWWGGKREVGV